MTIREGSRRPRGRGTRSRISVLLRSKVLHKSFGGVQAVRDISLAVPPGSVFAIIGPNGAGKSTLLNLMSGLYQPDAGTMSFDGVDLVGLTAHTGACGSGLRARSRRSGLFKQLSVLDNVIAGLSHPSRHTQPGNMFSRGRAFGATTRAAARRRGGFWPLSVSKSGRIGPAGSLAYGEQRMLEIARALATSPRLLMVDEPAAGLNARGSRAADRPHSTAAPRGMTVIVVEHNMDLVMKIADRVLVMDYGQHLFEGTPAEVQANPAVISAYLGHAFARIRMTAEAAADSARARARLWRGSGLPRSQSSRWPRARSSRSSAPTVPANRPRCVPSPGRFARAPARSVSAEQDITRLPSHERSALGIALVPEGRRVFPFLTRA